MISEEYNAFVMHLHGNSEPLTLFDVEVILYMHEVQLEKFKKELDMSNVSRNVAHNN